MAPSRRRPQNAGSKGGKAPLSPSQENGTPPLVSPRGVGNVNVVGQHRHQHQHQNQHQHLGSTQSLDLFGDVFDDDEEAVAMCVT